MVNTKQYGIIMGVVGIVSIAALFMLLQYQEAYTMHHAILEDLSKLEAVFDKIDTRCHITHIDGLASSINFLNVKNFVGSEVGPLNFEHPEKWEGPYMQDNPTMQGIDYQIIKTKEGVFILPGNGVKLPNGKVIGKDIIIDANTSIKSLIHDTRGLVHKGDSFARQILQKHNKFSDERSVLFEMIEED